MLKKFLPLLLLPFLLGGCQATITNLTARQQVRNANNLYTVEAAFVCRQQSLRWDSIKPQVVVGTEFYTMKPVPLMTNRWEGVISIPPGTSIITYRYKFDFLYNDFGPPQPDSARSQEFTLKILEQ